MFILCNLFKKSYTRNSFGIHKNIIIQKKNYLHVPILNFNLCLIALGKFLDFNFFE